MKNNKKGTATLNTPVAKPGYIYANGKMVALSQIREGFDGVSKEAKALPEGKLKTSILNAIEGAYFNTVEWLKAGFSSPVETA